MKLLFSLFILICNHFVLAQSQNPYLALRFTKVIMYDYEGHKDYFLSIVDKDGNLASSIKKQVELDRQTVNALNSKLGNKSSYGAATAACFDPHLGFVYYNNEKIVAFISICLSCNRLQSSLELSAQMQGKTGSGTDVYYTADGMSDYFRKYLNTLLRKYNFSHQIER